MQITAIGIAASSPGGLRSLAQLDAFLEHAQSLGYDQVELDVSAYALIVDGLLRRPQLDALVGVLRNAGLRYSVHGLSRLNLAYDPRHALCKRIMACQIEICAAIGAQKLVYHSGLQALDAVRAGVRAELFSHEELAEGFQREIVALRELAPLAADAGVTIGLENGDSHQWEHQLLARYGQPRAAILDHHARLRVEPIVAQLAEINHPNIGMTLDIAHLHIAAYDTGFDYLAAIETAAPWVRHLHVNDNFGRLDRGFDTESDRYAFGEADLHLPPGWGSIPYPEVFARLAGYQGDLILEIKPGFFDQYGESLQTIRGFLNAHISVTE